MQRNRPNDEKSSIPGEPRRPFNRSRLRMVRHFCALLVPPTWETLPRGCQEDKKCPTTRRRATLRGFPGMDGRGRFLVVSSVSRHIKSHKFRFWGRSWSIQDHLLCKKIFILHNIFNFRFLSSATLFRHDRGGLVNTWFPDNTESGFVNSFTVTTFWFQSSLSSFQLYGLSS